MKRRAVILLTWLSLAVAAASAAPPVVVTRRNGQVVMRFGNGRMSETFLDPEEGEAADRPAPLPGAAGKLRWQNGETLPGELAGASAAALTWRTPLFEEPLLLGWTALRRYDQPGEAGTVADPFAFVLRDGSHVYGALIAITADAVAIHSTRHGDVRLKRAEVLSMRRVSRDGLPAGGPAGTVGWRLLSDQDQSGNSTRPAFGTPAPTAVAALATGPGGALDLPYWNTAGFREMEFPERVDLEFRVRATKRPDFSLVLEPGPVQNLRVATWDGEVVLAEGAQFVSLGHLADTDREVAFRVCWDRRTDRCLVTTPDGVRVVEWQFEAADDPPGGGAAQPGSEDRRPPPSANAGSNHDGLMLYNKGRDLTLENLRVRAWDGTPPAPADPARPGLWLADGRAVQGEIDGGSAEAVRLRLGGADAVAGFPLGEVDAIVFSPGVPAAPPDPPMTLTWADGTFLTGRMVGLEDGIAAISTPCTDVPLPARVDGLRQLLLPRDEEMVKVLSGAPPRTPGEPPPPARDQDAAGNPLPHRDKITAGDMTLHGDLSCLDDNQPHWLPVGGVRPAAPSRRLAYEIDRAHPAADGTVAPALFYTSAGDILPGDLRSLDASGVDFDSGYVEARKFRPGDLDAIEFNANVPARIDGFSSAGWQAVGGNAAGIERKADGSLKLAAGAALGHSWIMECSELRFVLANTDNTALRLRMFCADTDAAKAVNLALVRSGSMLYYGLETTEGQMENQQSTSFPKEAGPVRLVVTDQQVELFLGDKRLETFPVPLAKRAGSGLVLEPAAMWGNPVHAVELAGFAAEFRPGHVGMPSVNAEAKTQALTVPRFRKDDPPRQALIALNGDVLRGELTGATTRQFAFRSGLESLRVPRERVRAAVWLKPPAREAAAADSKPAVAERLEKRCILNGQYANMRLRDYVSIIFQWDPELKAKYPSHLPNQRLRMRFEQPTIAEALSQICTTFDVSYRLEGNSVVFAAVGATPPNMRQQTYWLRPDAFPDPGAAQAVLAAKGLSFPEGAYARWEPDNRQMVMTNTEENQRKLADVLRTDFGGSLGAPTHWLLLTDGTRLGLAVDRFDQQTVVGHHPIYGRCQVPLAAVAAIRTAAPEPSPAARLFADWRLVVAPEPVLPGAGGAGDALAGKEPKNFTLPLLGGGDFELAREKGKVVVLNFWATWCPPCIQSLPGLIEAMSAFPADQVRFVGVNEAEPATQVQRFLGTRGWKLAVALDAAQDVGLQFGAEPIPETVVIGPDGKVARVWTGYQPGEETEIADAVRKLMVDLPRTPKKNEVVPEARLLPDAAHAALPE